MVTLEQLSSHADRLSSVAHITKATQHHSDAAAAHTRAARAYDVKSRQDMKEGNHQAAAQHDDKFKYHAIKSSHHTAKAKELKRATTNSFQPYKSSQDSNILGHSKHRGGRAGLGR